MSLRRLLLLLALVLGLLGQASAAHAASLKADLVRLAKGAGGTGGFAVLDGRTGRSLAASGARARRPLGSTTKLITTSVALDVLGASSTLDTTALAGGAVDAGGTLAGDLVVRGGGDASLGEVQLAALADAVQAAGVKVVTGSVVGDESLFDALRGGPATDGAFDLNITGVLGALTYDRGRQAPAGPLQPDPARAAAYRLDDVLEARGVAIHGAPRAGATPAGAVELGHTATPVATIVRDTDKRSDDFYAEVLAKAIGAKAGRGGTTAGGVAAIRDLTGFLLADGSGVDEHSAGSAAQLAAFVRKVRGKRALAAALPVAGVDGTLAHRMRGGRTRGRCRAKTGSLPQHQVSALAGWCVKRGRSIVFAFLRERVSSQTAAKAAEDRMVERLLNPA